MGFDVYGMKPQQNTKIDNQKLYPVYSEVEQLEDWKENMTLREQLSKNDRETYWKSMERYEEDNPGIYFRNNVWWWRPLWTFVCMECEDLLTEKEIMSGSYNDGKEISSVKAKKMAKRLRESLNAGNVERYEKQYKKALKEEGEDSFAKNYPFSKENVERFAIFLEECGGFQIC